MENLSLLNIPVEKIFPTNENLSKPFTPDKWHMIEFYNNFRLNCIYTSVDNPSFTSYFTKTRFEPLVSFTFRHLDLGTPETLFFCFCSQETMAVIRLKKNCNNLISPLLLLMSRSFLNPTTPEDINHFVTFSENSQTNVFPFNLVNHGDAFTELDNFMAYYTQTLHLDFESNTITNSTSKGEIENSNNFTNDNNFNKDNNFNDNNNDNKNFTLASFLIISLRTTLLFLIRRNYFPSSWFYEPLFFTDRQMTAHKSGTDDVRFSYADFIFLRFLQGKAHGTESLYLHKDTGCLVSIKKHFDKKMFTLEREVYTKVKCPFIRPYYGYIPQNMLKGEKGGLVLGFMCNGTADDILKHHNFEPVLKSKIMIEVLIGLDTLNAHGYMLMLACPKDNILFDQNVCSFLSDFEQVKRIKNYQIGYYLSQTRLFALFIKTVGGPNFPEIEMGPIIKLYDTIVHMKDETVPLFYLIHLIKTQGLFFSWSQQTKIYELVSHLFNHQVITNREDLEYLLKQANSDDGEACRIIGSLYFYGVILPMITRNSAYYWMKAPNTNFTAKYQLGLYIERMKVPGYFAFISNLASNGHSASQLYIGMNSLKKGIPEFYNTGVGLQWLFSAAHIHDNPEANHALGKLHEEGQIIRYDIKKAINYYIKAANHFFNKAYYDLGRIHYYGIGVKKNFELAFFYLTYASFDGENRANYLLSKFYLKGIVVEKNIEMAISLLSAQSLQTDSRSQLKLFKISASDPKKAVDILSRTVIASNSHCSPKLYRELANLYNFGTGTAMDRRKAYDLYKISAEKGDFKSQFILSLFYYRNNNVKFLIPTLISAAKHENSDAQVLLGWLYLTGDLIPQNILKGVALIKASMNQMNYFAFAKCGELFLQDNYLRHNFHLAYTYFSQGSERWNINSAFLMACMFLDGYGINKDYEKAFKLLSYLSPKSPRAAVKLAEMVLRGLGTPGGRRSAQKAVEILKSIELSIKVSGKNDFTRHKAEYLRYIDRGFYEEPEGSPIPYITDSDIGDYGDFSGVLFQGKVFAGKVKVPNVEINLEEAFKKYRKAAHHCNTDAMCELAYFYENGIYVKKDFEAAFRWYQMSANYGHIKSAYKAGEFLYYGKGVKKNIITAQKHLTDAANKGHTLAQSLLALLFFDSGDFKSAFQFGTYAAQADDPEAQKLLAILYHDGLGVPKNMKLFLSNLQSAESKGCSEATYMIGKYYEDDVGNMKQAFQWYNKAAQKENLNAIVKVAAMLMEGRGVGQQDPKQSLKWYKKAAHKGDHLSMICVGKMYMVGKGGVEINNTKAAKWFKRSAESGNSNAMYGYAQMLEKGVGVPINFETAYEWYSLAAKKGESKAFGKIMHMYACGMHRRKVDTPIPKLQELIEKKNDTNAMIDMGDIYYYGYSGIGKDDEKAKDLYQKAADLGSDIAQYKLAVIYESKDRTKSASLFEKSAKNGNLASMVFISDIYNKNKQYDKALHWYEKCSQAGLTHAKLVIGRMYADGQGTPIDKTKAMQYFQEAAECGSAEAKFECAKLLIEDENPNFFQILNLLKESANGDCGDAMNMLGLMFREGLGCPVDELRAKSWFTSGSMSGSNQATLNLAKMSYESKNKDIQTALTLFTKASEKGSIVAKLYLAKIYKNGEGTHKDEIRAGDLYMEVAKMEGMETTDAGLEDLRLAATCRNPSACNIVGMRILQGLESEKGEQIFKKSRALFQTAAKNKITNALYQLGLMFDSGLGIQKNRDKAIKFLREAAEEGSELALNKLKEISPNLESSKNNVILFNKKNEECPYLKTGDKLIKMHAYECLTCNVVNENALCQRCILKCHKGHNIIDTGMRTNTFCHCICISSHNLLR